MAIRFNGMLKVDGPKQTVGLNLIQTFQKEVKILLVIKICIDFSSHLFMAKNGCQKKTKIGYLFRKKSVLKFLLKVLYIFHFFF